MKPNNIIALKCTADSFYRMWIEFLTPFHKLTAREKDVAARLIAQYFKLREHSEDPVVLRELLWSKTSKKDMIASLGMSQAYFQMVISRLKENGVIVNGDLNPKYIPHKSTEEPRFILQVVYDWSTPKNPIKNEAK